MAGSVNRVDIEPSHQQKIPAALHQQVSHQSQMPSRVVDKVQDLADLHSAFLRDLTSEQGSLIWKHAIPEGEVLIDSRLLREVASSAKNRVFTL